MHGQVAMDTQPVGTAEVVAVVATPVAVAATPVAIAATPVAVAAPTPKAPGMGTEEWMSFWGCLDDPTSCLITTFCQPCGGCWLLCEIGRRACVRTCVCGVCVRFALCACVCVESTVKVSPPCSAGCSGILRSMASPRVNSLIAAVNSCISAPISTHAVVHVAAGTFATATMPNTSRRRWPSS